MGLQYTPYTIPLLLAAALSALQVYLGWQRSDRRATNWYAITYVCIGAWSLIQAAVLSTTSAGAEETLLLVLLPISALTGLSWGLFGLIYSGYGDRVTRPVVAGVAALVGFEFLLVLTNGQHGLVLTNVHREAASWGPILAYEFGPVVWAYVAITYAVFAVGTAALFQRFLRSRNVYRKLSFSLCMGGLTLGVANLTTFAGLSPFPHLTFLPLVSLFWAVVAVLVLTSVRFVRAIPLDAVLARVNPTSKTLTPVARDTVMEELDNGVIILDDDGRIVDVNPLGRHIVAGDRSDSRIVGKRLVDVVDREVFFDDELPFLQREAPAGEYTGVWARADDGREVCFDITLTDIEREDGTASGRAVLVHDVTERERRKRRLEERTRELERQNDQLEDFASIVSHDLRNPLNVAQGYAELAEARHDWEFADDMQQSLGRMERIIEDVLAMARQGKTLDETEPVDLADLARTAWGHVDTGEATLEVAVDLTVEADRQRLARAFENLFRNAVEHGRPDVTVTVGSLADGFYVADDGPGIPPDERDDVFQQGFTTSETGTGFGLSIVRTVVEAHGWEIAITASEPGAKADGGPGARFEITGLGSAAPGARQRGTA
ncbi:MAG: histidine kinase N-terminal 7TM domain-containing protein [Haloarculaceae archaeon]